MEIKTAKRPPFTLDHFRQLAGYAALRKLAGRPDLREMGVRLARYGKLLTVDADVIYGALGFEEFLGCFSIVPRGYSGREAPAAIRGRAAAGRPACAGACA